MKAATAERQTQMPSEQHDEIAEKGYRVIDKRASFSSDTLVVSNIDSLSNARERLREAVDAMEQHDSETPEPQLVMAALRSGEVTDVEQFRRFAAQQLAEEALLVHEHIPGSRYDQAAIAKTAELLELPEEDYAKKVASLFYSDNGNGRYEWPAHKMDRRALGELKDKYPDVFDAAKKEFDATVRHNDALAVVWLDLQDVANDVIVELRKTYKKVLKSSNETGVSADVAVQRTVNKWLYDESNQELRDKLKNKRDYQLLKTALARVIQASDARFDEWYAVDLTADNPDPQGSDGSHLRPKPNHVTTFPDSHHGPIHEPKADTPDTQTNGAEDSLTTGERTKHKRRSKNLGARAIQGMAQLFSRQGRERKTIPGTKESGHDKSSEQEKYLPLTREEAMKLLSYSDAYTGQELHEATEWVAQDEAAQKYMNQLIRLSELHGQDELLRFAKAATEQCRELADTLDMPLSTIAKSTTWALWDIAKQCEYAAHPELVTDNYRDSVDIGDRLLEGGDDVLTDTDLSRVVERHLGWEYARARDMGEPTGKAVSARLEELYNSERNDKHQLPSYILDEIGKELYAITTSR